MSETQLYAYENVIDGTRHVFAEPRPDLEARGNFQVIDPAGLSDALRDAALRAKAQADAIATSARIRAGEQVYGDGESNSTSLGVSPVSGVTVSETSGRAPVGGVLSRGIVKSAYTREELEQKALDDAEALATSGVLASHLDGDRTRVDMPAGAQAVVVSAAPAGSDPAAKKTAGRKGRTGTSDTDAA